MKKIFLYIAGVFTILLSVLHLSFWKTGNWSVELKKISPDNAGILQALNIGSIYFLLYSTIITFVIARKSSLETTDKLFLSLVAGYYIARIIMGFPLFGVTLIEIFIQVICLLVACCYLIPLKLKK